MTLITQTKAANLSNLLMTQPVLTTGKDIEEATTKMNNALSKVKEWFLMNKLNLNPSKTRYIIFNHKTDKTDHLTINDTQNMRV